MNSFKWFLSIVIICLCNISCENKCNINGVEIGSLLISNAEEQGVNYCELVEKSFNNDNISIRQLCLLHFENSVGYAYGEVLVSLLAKIGEQQFLNALKGISKSEKHRVESYLDVGLEYGESHFVKDDFPKVYFFLKE
jgi:hypothetical protein